MMINQETIFFIPTKNGGGTHLRVMKSIYLVDPITRWATRVHLPLDDSTYANDGS